MMLNSAWACKIFYTRQNILKLRVLLVAFGIGRARDDVRRVYATFLQEILHSLCCRWRRKRVGMIEGFIDLLYAAVQVLIFFIVVWMLHFLFELFTTIFRRMPSIVHEVIAWLQLFLHMFTIKISIAAACK